MKTTKKPVNAAAESKTAAVSTAAAPAAEKKPAAKAEKTAAEKKTAAKATKPAAEKKSAAKAAKPAAEKKTSAKKTAAAKTSAKTTAAAKPAKTTTTKTAAKKTSAAKSTAKTTDAAKAPAKRPGRKPVVTIDSICNKVEKKISKTKAAAVKEKIAVDIEVWGFEDGSKKMYIEINDGKATVSPHTYDAKDFRISISVANAAAFVDGKLTLKALLESNEFYAEGNVVKAIKLASVF